MLEVKHLNNTQFKRISLDQGQLSVVTPLLEDYPENFIELLIIGAPWYMRKFTNAMGRVEKFKIGDKEIMLKETRLSGSSTYRQRNSWLDLSVVSANTPSFQVKIVDEAKERYRKRFGEELSVEQLIAFYIDRVTTKKYMIYKYYPAIGGCSQHEFPKPAHKQRYNDLCHRLNSVGVCSNDHFGYIITEDSDSEVVLIDTEYWQILNVQSTNRQIK